jgi:hypothetical protein
MSIQDSQDCKPPSLVAEITRAVRAADQLFQKTGGSSRHWVIECLIPALEDEGLAIGIAITGTSTKTPALDVLREFAEWLRENPIHMGAILSGEFRLDTYLAARKGTPPKPALDVEAELMSFATWYDRHKVLRPAAALAEFKASRKEKPPKPALDLREVETIVRDVLDWLDGRGVWSPHAVNDYVAQYLISYAARKGANDERR